MALTKVTRNLLSTGIDDQSTSTAMTIDSSGNLLVGTTSASNISNGTNAGIGLIGQLDYIAVARDGGSTAYFNRLTSDGNIVEFRKDGTTVGSIGAQGGNLFIENGNVGLLLNDTTDELRPAGSGGVPNDNVVSLGSSAKRFKDLYLSGGAYLGGTAAANQLDDYEEGTWTAELKGSTSSATTPVTRTGTYTKVGNVVHVQVGFTNVNTTGASGSIQVTGLPFTNTSANSSTVTLGQYTKLAHSADSNPVVYINPSANLIQAVQYNDSAVAANWFITGTTGVTFYVSATYTI